VVRLGPLNLLTIVIAGSLFADAVVAGTLEFLVPAGLAGAVPAIPPATDLLSLSVPYQVAMAGLVVLVVALSYYPVTNMLSSGQAMNRAFDPFNLVNTYGAFGSITKTRYEIVVQGTREETVTADTEWETYEFTDPETRRETGRWWDRERVGTYYGPVGRRAASGSATAK